MSVMSDSSDHSSANFTVSQATVAQSTVEKPSPAVIPYSCQTMDDSDIQAVVEVLKSDRLTQGPSVHQFESAVANYCGVDYAVAFSSGTSALHAACAVAGLQEGDEGITSTLSFVASANAMAYCGATPRLADIDPATFNICTSHAKTLITDRTKVLIPVHFAGAPVDLNACYELADAHNLVVIEDASHAFGGHTQNKPIGRCRDMAVFSFHPVKSLTTGEGGMVLTSNRHFYEQLLAFRCHGMIRDPHLFVDEVDGGWHYEVQQLGYNYRITDMQCALGLNQLKRLDEFVRARDAIVRRYQAIFADHPKVRFQQISPDAQSAHHLFPIVLQTSDPITHRRELFDWLKAHRILTQVHYRPIHAQPFYRQRFGTTLDDCPNANAYYAGCLSLPVYPTLSEGDQQLVIDLTLQFLDRV